MLTLKAVKRLATTYTPMFLAIVRRIGRSSEKEPTKMNQGVKPSALCEMNAHGMTEGAERQKMKIEGPKKDFKSVEKRRK